MEYPIVAQAARLLRKHGVNAYEQEGELVLYEVNSGQWLPVQTFNLYLDNWTAIELAQTVTDWLGVNIQEHTHDD